MLFVSCLFDGLYNHYSRVYYKPAFEVAWDKSVYCSVINSNKSVRVVMKPRSQLLRLCQQVA